MQSNIPYLIITVAGLGLILSTVVAMAQTERTIQVRDTAQAACPAGYHWEDATYAHGGKWRDGHCTRDAAIR